jgi:hypothetical protein
MGLEKYLTPSVLRKLIRSLGVRALLFKYYLPENTIVVAIKTAGAVRVASLRCDRPYTLDEILALVQGPGRDSAEAAAPVDRTDPHSVPAMAGASPP